MLFLSASFPPSIDGSYLYVWIICAFVCASPGQYFLSTWIFVISSLCSLTYWLPLNNASESFFASWGCSLIKSFPSNKPQQYSSFVKSSVAWLYIVFNIPLFSVIEACGSDIVTASTDPFWIARGKSAELNTCHSTWRLSFVTPIPSWARTRSVKTALLP